MVKIYRNLEVNEDLVIAGDPGEGVSYCAAVAISRKYKDTPLVYHARTESPNFGYELNKLGLYVRKKTGEMPLIAVERNIGQATIAKLLDLGYPYDKLYRQKSFDRINRKEEIRVGWVTTSANRRKMLDDLAFDIRNKVLKIYDREIIGEMLTFIINERTNEPRPESGKFSDLIMALAIANQVRKETNTEASWAPQVNKPEDKRRLPATAEGFIVEHFQPKQDWRNA